MELPVSSSQLKGVVNNYNNQLLSYCLAPDRRYVSLLLSPGISADDPFAEFQRLLDALHSLLPILPLSLGNLFQPSSLIPPYPVTTWKDISKTSVQKGTGGLMAKIVGWVEGAEIKGTTLCTALATARLHREHKEFCGILGMNCPAGDMEELGGGCRKSYNQVVRRKRSPSLWVSLVGSC